MLGKRRSVVSFSLLAFVVLVFLAIGSPSWIFHDEAAPTATTHAESDDDSHKHVNASTHENATSADTAAKAHVSEDEEVPVSEEDLRLLHQVNPAAPSTPDTYHCPPTRIQSVRTADGKNIHEAMVKYTRYTRQYCNRTGMLQMHVGLRSFIFFMDIIARVVRIQPGYHLFDWGSGCGTMLNYYAMKWNTTGIGIDVTAEAVHHAVTHRRPGNHFCWMDGSDIRSFPSDAFDAVVSWATLYHVRRTLVQCMIVHQLVRMLKPGGYAFIGHLRTEKTQEYWKKRNKCPIPGASWTRYRDYKLFHMPQLPSQSVLFCGRAQA